MVEEFRSREEGGGEDVTEVRLRSLLELISSEV
jgi:hypothetical protein